MEGQMDIAEWFKNHEGDKTDRVRELDAKYNIPSDYQKKEGWTDDWHYTELETPAEHGIYYVIHELRNSDHWDYTYMAWFHGYWWAYAGYGNKWLICNDKPREWMIPFAWVEVPDLYYRTDDSYQHLREIFPSEKDWEYEKRMMEIHEENKRWIEEHRGGAHGTCKGCTNRTLGCHDTCPSYMAEVMASEEKKEQERKAKFAYSALTDHEISGRRKSVRRHGRKA